MHNASDDNALMETFSVVVGYARVMGGDTYASQLIKLGKMDDFCTSDIKNISQYAGVSSGNLPFGFHATVQLKMI